MRTSIFIFGIFIAVVAVLLFFFVGVSQFYPSYTYKYRISVSVERDGQTYTGSSVIGVKLQTQPPLLGAPPLTEKIVGDAVFVDLGDGRNVVALLEPVDPERAVDLPSSIVPKHFRLPTGSTNPSVFTKLTGSWTLPKELEPAFLSFEHAGDPTSARLINGAAIQAALGNGTRAPVVTIEMTQDEPVLTIRKHLPWLGNAGRPAWVAIKGAGYFPYGTSNPEAAFERR